jgi:hypothetical protein
MTFDRRATLAAVVDIWNGAAADGLEQLLAPGYRGHVLGIQGGERGAAAYAGVIGRFRTANPGVTFHVIEQIDAGDRCVSRLEATRPGSGTAAAASSQGMNISRFDHEGRLAEEWAIWSAWLDA